MKVVLRSTLQSLARCESGAAATLLALSLPALAGVAALAVDLSSLYLAERRLQGIADAAAAASISGDIANGESAARAMVANSGTAGIILEQFQPGHYARDAALAPQSRFTPNAPGANAARVQLRQEVPLFFAGLAMGRSSSNVTVSATAAKSDLVGFEIGSKLIHLSDGLPAMLLSTLAGVNLGLTDTDISLLATAQVDVADFMQALRQRNAGGDGSFSDSLDTPTPLADAIGALGDSVDADTAVVVENIAALAVGDDVAVGDLIDLGPWGQGDAIDARLGAQVNVYTLLRSLLEAGHGPAYSIAMDVGLPGVGGTTLRVAGGHGWQRSPWMTFDEAGDVTVRTSMTRIGLDINVGSSLLGDIVAVRLPLFVELAPAEARISKVACDPADPDHGVTLDVRPSIGTVALADFDVHRMEDVDQPLPLRNAELIRLLGLASVKGYANVALGGDRIYEIPFSPEQIAAGSRQHTPTRDLLATAIPRLMDDVRVDIQPLGFSLGLGSLLSSGPATQTVRNALEAVAPSLDGLLNRITALLGVELGVAEVSVNALRCGRPMIVA